MELTPAVIIILAIVAVVSFVLIRRGSQEAAAPVDTPVTPVQSNPITARSEPGNASLVDWLLERAAEQTGMSVADDALARQRITEAADEVMEELRAHGSATISLPFLTADARGPKHFSVQFKRKLDSTFELQH